MAFLFTQQVGLVEHKRHRHAVSLGRSEEAVYEGGACLRIVNRHDKESLVYVCRNDVALLAQVLRLTDDVVVTVLDGVDKGCALLVTNDLHTVAHSHRIGAAYALEAEVALYLAVHNGAVVGLHRVPAACVLNY